MVKWIQRKNIRNKYKRNIIHKLEKVHEKVLYSRYITCETNNLCTVDKEHW